ncbi:transcriptional repressor NrdR [Candidatus Woesearchaeota archaeon]|nr:transcriptional repressor NrdR [Candidatus Woesearchaeota archaeon]
MKCLYCDSEESRVVDKRDLERSIRRRRECLKCKNRFTTYETPEAFEFFIVKKDGRREQFSREKVAKGITKACEKRPIPQEKIEEIANQIEQELIKKEKKEISSREVGAIVMRKLKSLDKVAYIRFASVYRDFDLESFEKEIKKLGKR